MLKSNSWFTKLFKQSQIEFSYQPPDPGDPKLSPTQKQSASQQRVYDFYFFDYIQTELLKGSPYYGMGGDEKWNSLIDALNKGKVDLVNMMKRDYTEDLRFSSSCEMRHLWDSQCKFTVKGNTVTPEQFFKHRADVAREIEKTSSSSSSQQKEIYSIEQAIKSLSQMNAAGVPSLETTKKNQIATLQKHLDELQALGGKNREKAKQEYVESLVQRFLVNKEHGWKVAKKGLSPDAELEWKRQQLDIMGSFIMGASSAEWDAIAAKAAKFKKALPKGSPFTFGDYRDKRYDGIDDGYRNAYFAGYVAGLSNREISLLSTSGFLDPQWSGSYGGPGWAVIAKTFGTIDVLSHSKNMNELCLAIDLAHNLQHNTGSAFNKASTIYGNGGWFESVLNFKASSKTEPEDFLEHITPSLAIAGQFYLYNTGRPSKQSKDKMSKYYEDFDKLSKSGKLCDYLINTNFKSTTAQLQNEKYEQLLQYRNEILEKLDYIKQYEKYKNNEETDYDIDYENVAEWLKGNKLNKKDKAKYRKELENLKKNKEVMISEAPNLDANQLNKQLENLNEQIKQFQGTQESETIKIYELTFIQPNDLYCLAQNKYFDKSDRAEFLRGIQKQQYFGKLTTDAVNEITVNFYKSQALDDEEIDGILDSISKEIYNPGTENQEKQTDQGQEDQGAVNV